MVEICFVEPEVRKTYTWKDEVIKHGGISGVNTEAIIGNLQTMYSGRLYDMAQNNKFLLMGAWLEYCIGHFANFLLADCDAEEVGVNLNKTISWEEFKTGKSFSWEEKKDLILSCHIMLAYDGRFVLK